MLIAPRNRLLLALFYEKEKNYENSSLACYMCEYTIGHMIVTDIILEFDVRYFEEFNHASSFSKPVLLLGHPITQTIG